MAGSREPLGPPCGPCGSPSGAKESPAGPSYTVTVNLVQGRSVGGKSGAWARLASALGVLAVLAAPGALAYEAKLGGALMMAFPFGSLTNRVDQFGAPVLPGPGVGARVRLGPVRLLGDAMPELSGDVVMFHSNTERDLELVYVPVLAGAAWETANVIGLSVMLRVAVGPGFLASNTGDRRSLGTGVAMFGWELGRELEGSVMALQFGIDIISQRWPIRRPPWKEGAWGPRAEGGVRVCLVMSTK